MTEEEIKAIKQNLHEKIENPKSTYGIPLRIERGKGNRDNIYRAYVCLLKSNYKFPSSTIRHSNYGWVTLNGTDVGRFAKPGVRDYWKSMVIITKKGSSQETILSDPQGVLVEHPYFSSVTPPPEGVAKRKLVDAPHIKKATLADVVTYYVERHDKWRVLAPDSMQGLLLRSFPKKGWEKEAYLKGTQVKSGLFLMQNTSDSWAELKGSLKSVVDVDGMARDLRQGFIKDNLITQEDNTVIQKNDDGTEVEKKSKTFSKASFKVVEYPRLKPERFKLARNRFNKLLSTTPSSIIKPINTWVKSVSDVELFAIAGLASIFQILSLGTAFKPLDNGTVQNTEN